MHQHDETCNVTWMLNANILSFTTGLMSRPCPSQMHETRHITVPVYSEGIDAEKSEATPEGQQLVEEGVPETKGEREYPV